MNIQTPLTNQTNHAKTGLIIALAGLAQLVMLLLFSLMMLFFAPMLMCGSTLFAVPFSLGAIIFGWKGRKENPKMALAAILIGAALIPMAFGLAWIFGDLLYEATA